MVCEGSPRQNVTQHRPLRSQSPLLTEVSAGKPGGCGGSAVSGRTWVCRLWWEDGDAGSNM